jgi:hypothetical protein
MKTNTTSGRSNPYWIRLLKFLPAILLGGALLAAQPVATAHESERSNKESRDEGRGDRDSRLHHSFTLLLQGLYKPITHGPNLGLSMVDLNDGTYAKVPAYGIRGIGCGEKDEAIGTFYARLDMSLPAFCAYQLPGGSISAFFMSNNLVQTLDADGNGVTLVGTWELEILEATGKYRDFADGTIHMVDELHISFLDGVFDERHCYCTISR